jgi:serine/threonine protein kinase
MGIVRQLVTGYLSLWKNGIVHRDLKPANILIKEGTIKLADFGFVSWNSSCSEPFTYNVGSPSYMAPEALRRNVYSYKSDIWALGVIAFELTFGKVPWRNSNDLFLYQMLMN